MAPGPAKEHEPSLEEIYNQLMYDFSLEGDDGDGSNSSVPTPLTPRNPPLNASNGNGNGHGYMNGNGDDSNARDSVISMYSTFDSKPNPAVDMYSSKVYPQPLRSPIPEARARPLPRPPSDQSLSDAPHPPQPPAFRHPPPPPPLPAFNAFYKPPTLSEPPRDKNGGARSRNPSPNPSPGLANRRLPPDPPYSKNGQLTPPPVVPPTSFKTLPPPPPVPPTSFKTPPPPPASSKIPPPDTSEHLSNPWAPSSPPNENSTYSSTPLKRQISRPPPKGAYTPNPPGFSPSLYGQQAQSSYAYNPDVPARSSADIYSRSYEPTPTSPTTMSSSSGGASSYFFNSARDSRDSSTLDSPTSGDTLGSPPPSRAAKVSPSYTNLPSIASAPPSPPNYASSSYTRDQVLESTPTTLDRKISASSQSTTGSAYQTASSSAYLTPSTSNLLDSYSITTSQPSYSASTYHREHDDFSNEKIALKARLELHDESDDDEFPVEDDDEDEERFVNLALLSHLAVRLRDKVPRGTHVKGSIPYPRAFTGKDIVSTIQAAIQRELVGIMGASSSDRSIALQVARSLQSQLFFYEVEWGGRQLTDGVEDVYMFLDDSDTAATGGAATSEGQGRAEREELPTAVITVLTKCYSPSCGEGGKCYSYGCPRGAAATSLERHVSTLSAVPSAGDSREVSDIPPELLATLPPDEVNRQNIIREVIMKEERYIQDLELIDTLFIRPLRRSDPPIFPREELDDFVSDVFFNLHDLRQCNKRLLEMMHVRQREQAPLVSFIGDVFLTGATDFRSVYPAYVGHLPVAEKRMKDAMEANPAFRMFLEQCGRRPESRGFDLKHFISRPSEHLQKYPVLLDAILDKTAPGNPDADYLSEAIQAIKNLSNVAHLLTFQSAMCRGPSGKLDWADLVSPEVFKSFSKAEAKRQAIIFELIKGEMEYVKDLELIETIFVTPLLENNVIPRERLSTFIEEVFHNVADIHKHHRLLLDRLHIIQQDQHPSIRSITAPVYDAALNWTEAYMEYVPHYPIAAYRIDEELANNPAFKAFVEQASRHPDARRLDIKFFVNRPIPRILRYDLLLTNILDHSPPTHEDRETIPQVLEVLKSLAKGTNTGISSAEQKVRMWKYNANLVWRPGEFVDMDLLDESRSLIHYGKLLRSSEGNLEWNGWTELFVLLFDNYLLLTKPREKDGVTKYNVYRRPMPLELVSILGFDEPAQQRSTSLLRGPRIRAGDPPVNGGGDSSGGGFVYPCSIHNVGRVGGHHHLFAESAQIRQEWKDKLKEAISLRTIVNDANKVFEPEILTASTFKVPSFNAQPSWEGSTDFTGKVTCSVPFTAPDGRGLVAIGCAEGVWIGLRHDANSLRRVLHLKMVTQCAMLEDFGIFVVLADKSLFAYHIEALVPSNPLNQSSSRTPQKLNGTKDVQFFTVGNLNGRTLVIYMKKKGLDSVFRALEPVVGKIAEKTKAPGAFGRFNFGSQKSDWFRVYRDFFLPAESYDLIFLKAKVSILCTRGFEIMDLVDLKSATIPQNQDPRFAAIAKRCESCRPMGMFRSTENEFLLCYDEFGLYVDRHGDPSKTRSSVLVEWEGTAERVAFHAPYVLIFDQRFIEIRHIDKCNLVQIIRGTDIRCTWDGRGTLTHNMITTPGPDGWNESGMVQESRVHVARQAESQGNGDGKVVVQEVLQLVPTLPIFLPPPLTSPASSTYFQQSRLSPPHSPQLRPSMSSWR